MCQVHPDWGTETIAGVFAAGRDVFCRGHRFNAALDFCLPLVLGDGMATTYRMFTGGVLETNCYLVDAPDGRILIDAPDECASWLAREGVKVDYLLLTHGHFDHVMDAARIKREHGCKVGYHRDGLPMLTDPHFFRKAGFELEIEPVLADEFFEESEETALLGLQFQVLLVPGHCPGSLCFLLKDDRLLFGGDVLFAGGIGRWDLPGGDFELLMDGLQKKILTLDDETVVLPGHGPPTTIGREQRTNPYLQ